MDLAQMDFIQILLIIIALTIGTALRTLIPLIRKKMENKAIKINWGYLITSIINIAIASVGTAVALIFNFVPPDAPYEMIVIAAVAYGYGGQDLVNEIAKYLNLIQPNPPPP